MPAPLQAESTLTDRYQTTVPETVRQALRLGKRDKIRYTIGADGAVVLSRAADTTTEDPALTAFLDLLAGDIATRPERLRAVEPELVQRARSLVGGVQVDFEAALSEDDE
jgi:antitoxin PrlF